MENKMKKIYWVLLFLLLIMPSFCKTSLASTSGLLISDQYSTSIPEQLYSPYGINKQNENISTFSGELSTSVTDLTLPGKNGHDLIIKREYGSKNSSELFIAYFSMTLSYYEIATYYYSKEYVYSDSEGALYAILFNSEQNMLDWAPDEFYAITDFKTYPVVTNRHHIKSIDSPISYSRFKYERINSSTGTKLTRVKNLPGTTAVIRIWTDMQINRDQDLTQGRPINYGWSYIVPTLKRNSYDDTDYWDDTMAVESPINTRGYDYSEFRWDNAFLRDFEGNVLEIGTGKRKVNNEWTPYMFYARHGTGIGYKFNYLSIYDQTINGLTYNRTITDTKGRILYINAAHSIIACEDKYGNRILYNGNTIIDTMGRVITLDTTGIIYTQPGSSEIRKISFAYSSENDNSVDPYNNLRTDNKYIMSVLDENGSETVYQYKLKELLYFDEYFTNNLNDLKNISSYYGTPADSYALTKIVAPNYDEKYYEYINVCNYVSNNMSSQTKFKVSKSYDVLGGIRKNEYNYTYNNPYEGKKSSSTLTGTKTRVSDNQSIVDYYSGTMNPYKTLTIYPSKTIQYGYGGSERKFISSIIETEGSYTTTKSYNYDTNYCLTSESDGIYSATYTYDPTYNVMLTKTYLKDASTTIKIENTLTTDKKGIAISKVFENNVLKSQTMYDYDLFGNVVAQHLWEKDIDNDGAFDDNEKTTVYTEYTYNPDSTMKIKKYIQNIADVDGTITTEINPEYNFNYYGELTSVKNENGKITQLEYDKKSRPIKQINPDLTYKSLEYNEQGNYTILTDENGNKVKQIFDIYEKPTKKYLFVNNDWLLSEENSYNVISQLASNKKYILYNDDKTVNQLAETQYEYDPNDRVKKQSILNENGVVISAVDFSYTFAANEYKVTSTPKSDTNITPTSKIEYYDKVGNLFKVENKDAAQTLTETYEYNYLKNMVRMKDPIANATANSGWTNQYTYDYAGQKLTETNAVGGTINNVYDYKGRLKSKTDYKGNIIQYNYDKLDRLLEQTVSVNDTQTAKSKFYYDKKGNIIKEKILKNIDTAEQYNEKENQYDDRNRLSKVIQKDGSNSSITEYEYDDTGKIKKLRTGKTNTNTSDFAETKYFYNQLNQLIKVTDPMNADVNYKNDLLGRVIETVDKKGIITKQSYNIFSKPTLITAQSSDKTQTISYEYDVVGNPIKATNENGVTSYKYDNFSRLTQEILPNSIQNVYTYDANSNRKTYTLNKNSVAQITSLYDYDLLNRLTKVTNNGEETLYTYDQNNNLTLSTTGSKTTEYTYNKVNSLLTLKNKVGGVEKEAYSYTYYLDGNQASKTDKNGMTSYEYDGLGRLKNETLGQNVTSYTYDNYSNRQTMQKIGQDAFNVDYNYNKNNQLIKETKNIGDNTEITNYNYDANGNMYSKQIEELKPNTNAVPSLSLGILGLNSDSKDVIYNYNNFNQLEQVVTGSTTSNYTYNANGLRASKTVNGVKTNHIWDGQNIVAETDSANVVTARYLRGRQLISRIVGTDKEYYNYNGHGDTTSLTNASGSVIIDYTYDAFGKQANVSQNDTNPFRYCGEYTDLSSGLIYLRNRYYDPNIGRFISEDPAKSGLNWYIYCHNDPINYSDPLGLDENKKLRELVAESAGSVTWDKKNKTATVKIDGKKQEYVVQPDGNVSVNGNRVGYIDSNNSIILWDNDFYRDFNIVGTVTICAYWSPDEKFFIPGTEARSDELSGHSYIEYTPLGGSTDTYSTNPAYEQYDTDNGMQKNIISDRNLMNDPNTAKYSKKITKNQEIKMFKTINDPKNDKWTYTNNCTTFAQKVFYSATNAYFGSINTPYKLKNAIN